MNAKELAYIKNGRSYKTTGLYNFMKWLYIKIKSII